MQLCGFWRLQCAANANVVILAVAPVFCSIVQVHAVQVLLGTCSGVQEAVSPTHESAFPYQRRQSRIQGSQGLWPSIEPQENCSPPCCRYRWCIVPKTCQNCFRISWGGALHPGSSPGSKHLYLSFLSLTGLGESEDTISKDDLQVKFSSQVLEQDL